MLLLIDGDYILHRMLHTPAMWALTSGTLRTGGVFGTLKALMATLSQFSVVQAFLVFGGGRSPRRLALFPDYKGTLTRVAEREAATEEKKLAQAEYDAAYEANRRLLVYLLPHLAVRVFEAKYETDDVICHLALQSPDPVVILSDDRDMLTLVRRTVTVYRPMADQHVHLENFTEMVGLPTPFHFLLYKAVIGDPSDRIPGVPGVGEKTALPLLEVTDGTWDSLVEMASQSTNKRSKKVLEHQDLVERNVLLMDMTLEDLEPPEVGAILARLMAPVQVNVGKVSEALTRLNCKGLIEDLPSWITIFQRLR